MPGWNWQKFKQIVSNTLKLKNCWTFEIHLRSSSTLLCKDNKKILKNKQKNNCVCVDEIIRLIIMKITMKLKTDHIDTT